MKSTQLIDPLPLPSKRIPLGVILTLSFAVLTVIAVGLTGYLSFHNGRRAVNEVAGQLRREITTQIERQLESFLETSLLINQINANAAQQGLLEVDDPAALERYFWQQVQTFDTATSIYFGNIHGGLADAGREAHDDQPYVIATDGFQAGPFRKYATDASGNRAELLQTVPNFDARTRPWYTRAAESGQPAWSDIYILFTGQDMALAASQPVYDEAGRLLGVLANDIFLSDLSHFLQSLAIGRRGEAFIVEHSGLLVASSTDEPLLIPGDSGQPPQRLHVADSSVPLVRAGLAQVVTQFGGLESVEGNEQFEFELEGERYFGQIAPFRAVAGLDWLIVVVIPEADFMGPIAASTRQTWTLILATLGLALAGGFLVAQRVARPLATVSRAAKSLARGEAPPVVPVSWIEEVGNLTHAFNTMALRLSQSLERLTAEVGEREQAEEELQESRDQLAGILGAAMDAIVTVDENQKVVLFNAAAERMFGYAAADIIGQPHDFLLPERLRATHWQHIEKFGQTGATRRPMRHLAPLSALRADGQEFPVEVSISQVSVASHKLYTAILRDISEKVQREEALRQSEARYRSLFEDHPAVMFQLDPTNRAIVDVNPAAAAFYGWSREEMRGMKIDDVNTLSPAEIEAEIEQALLANKNHFTFKHRRADGSVREVEVFSGPFHHQGKKLLYSIVQDVTVRREVEEALHLNLERLSLATASAEIGIWETEITTGAMIWDDRMYELYGLERQTTTLTPETWLRLVHPDDVPAVEATGRAAIEGSQEYHLQFRIKRPDGQTRYVEAQATVLRDEASRPVRVIGVNRDVTEQVLASQSLAHSEARYRSVVEDMPGLVCRYGADGVLEFVNEAYTRYFGWEPAALIGQSFLSLIPEESRAEVRAVFDALTPEAPVVTHEHKVIAAGGEIRWQRWTDRALFDSTGQVIAYQAFGRDITEQKALELRLKTLNQALDNALTGFDIVGEDGRFIYANAAYADMWGYDSAEEIIGTSPVSHCADPDVPGYIMSQLKQNGELVLEFTARRKDGSQFEAVMYALRDFDHQGQEIYYGTSIDITARKQMEAALRQSEARYRTTLDNMLEGCQIIDFDWRYRYVNNAVTIQGKTTREALLGQTMLAQYPGIEQTDMFARLRCCMKERSATHLENEFIFPDGSKGWFELSVQPVPEGLFILSMDITERKKAAEALAQSELRYRGVVNDQTEFICRFTPDFVLTFVNEAYGRLFNRPPEEELVGQNLMQLIHPENRQPLRDKVAGLTPQEPVADDQHSEFMVDGSLRWLHWTDRGLFDEAGRLVEVQAVGRDITEQLEAQRQLEFQKTLLECELEASPDGILIASEAREWLYVNRRFIEMWGLPPEVVAARSVAGGLAHVRNLVAEPERFMADLDYLYTHPSEVNRQEIRLNDDRVFERYTAPVVSASGDYYGRLWSYRDVTRQRQLETQLLQAQKMEAIGRLAGGIAHDFNNILVPIVGYVELSLMKLSPGEKLHTDLKRVREAAERATGLTRQILAFSRKQVLQMEIVDLNKVVEDFQKMTRRLIGEDIELETRLEPALFRVKADPGQIGQVLLNLAVNARDAMPLGGQLTLETANVYLDQAYVKRYAEAQPPGQYVMLAVSDTGHGMDAATRQQIFEPFFTTKERGKGTGLGLSTVFGIVKQHGGNIWVYSEPGQGATFKIYLPIAEASAPLSDLSLPEVTAIYGTETVLVVEDEEMVRKLVCETLTEHGYQVLEAHTPADALHLAATRPGIHLLLTDVIMPEMNGRELSQKVIALRPEIKVLFMSGYTDDVVVHHGILQKGVNFLQKPFTVQSLTQKVREVLDYRA